MNRTTPTETRFASQILVRVAENLYRNDNGTYYVKLKKNGKQYKQSLDTHDRKTADRKLADFIKEIENKEQELPDLPFPEFADRWLEAIKPRMKESSYARRVSSVKQLKPLFRNAKGLPLKVREITLERLQEWEKERTGVSNRTFTVDRETLHLIFKHAGKLRILAKNPIDKENLPKRKEAKALVNSTIFKQKSARSSMLTASLAIGLAEDQAFTHHDLRHFFCSNAIEAGVDFATIANWLGHSDGGKLAASTYGHLRKNAPPSSTPSSSVAGGAALIRTPTCTTSSPACPTPPTGKSKASPHRLGRDPRCGRPLNGSIYDSPS